MITIPLLMIFAYGFAYIKYNEGFLDIGGTSTWPHIFNFVNDANKTFFGSPNKLSSASMNYLTPFILYDNSNATWAGSCIVVVRPYTFWRPEFRRAIFPLMLVFSFAWSFEMITHLEGKLLHERHFLVHADDDTL